MIRPRDLAGFGCAVATLVAAVPAAASIAGGLPRSPASVAGAAALAVLLAVRLLPRTRHVPAGLELVAGGLALATVAAVDPRPLVVLPLVWAGAVAAAVTAARAGAPAGRSASAPDSRTETSQRLLGAAALLGPLVLAGIAAALLGRSAPYASALWVQLPALLLVAIGRPTSRVGFPAADVGGRALAAGAELVSADDADAVHAAAVEGALAVLGAGAAVRVLVVSGDTRSAEVVHAGGDGPGPAAGSGVSVAALAEAGALVLPLRTEAGRANLVVLRDAPVAPAERQALDDHLTNVVLALQRLESAARAERSERRYRALVAHTTEVITVVDADRLVRFTSPAVAGLLGYTPDELLGTRLDDLLVSEDRPLVADRLRRTGRAGDDGCGAVGRFEARMRHRDGRVVETETVGEDLLDDPGLRGIVLTTRDLTERRELEQRLEQAALFDPLTGLANRRLLRHRIAEALVRAQHSGRVVTVLAIDLDGFKGVNDRHGQAVGDQLLVAVGDRLRTVVEFVDTAARVGDDEFAVLVEGAHDRADAAMTAELLKAALRAPFTIDGTPITIGASVGVAVGEAGDPGDLVRDADMALRLAKRRGSGTYEVFEPSMQVARVEALELEADLRAGIAAGDLRLRYQPIVDLRRPGHPIAGVEALVRWQHPERGLLTPDRFVPLAEETGLIGPLGEFVLREAFRQMRVWRDFHGGPGYISVNLSGQQLEDPHLAATVGRVLAEQRLDPGAVVLEITESVLMADVGAAVAQLSSLKALGVRLAIDDFGTGYSSLSYLRDFPVDVLKIDKSFIDGVAGSQEDSALARTILHLARSLGLSTIAEGIEQADQRDALVRHRCDYGQGYLFARPLEAEQIPELLGAAEADDDVAEVVAITAGRKAG